MVEREEKNNVRPKHQRENPKITEKKKRKIRKELKKYDGCKRRRNVMVRKMRKVGFGNKERKNIFLIRSKTKRKKRQNTNRKKNKHDDRKRKKSFCNPAGK